MKSDLKSILDPLKEYLPRVDQQIREKFKTGIPILDESALHLFESGGKRIRASIVILTSGLKNSIPEGIVELAAAAEIVHAASLIHDDIIDQSLLRRGELTVPKKWGNKVSVLTGDYMYSVALSLALADGNPRIFPLMVEGTKDMVKGELYQLQYSNFDSISRERYLEIIEMKTANFMGSCAKLGATKAEMDENEIDKLYNFGLNLGFAFQIIDDTLDIVDDSSQTGKDVGNDFKDGKITLPFLYLMENSRNDDIDLLRQYMSNPNEKNWQKLKARLKECNAIEYSINFSGTYIDRAINILNEFPKSEFRDALIDLSQFLLERTY